MTTEARPSIALAVLGDMLNEAEWDMSGPVQLSESSRLIRSGRVTALRQARERIAKVETFIDRHGLTYHNDCVHCGGHS